jgi:hypothetical protein
MTTTGCLTGKTESQKRKFFKSLHAFKKTDPQFYKEQLEDLNLIEYAEYRIWKDNRKFKPRPVHWIFTLHWWNPIFIVGMISAPFVAFFLRGGIAFGKTCAQIWDGFFEWDWS